MTTQLHQHTARRIIAVGAVATIAAGSAIAATAAASHAATRADVNAYVHVEQPHEGTWATVDVSVDTPIGPVFVHDEMTQSGGPSLTCYLLGVDPIQQC